jgi:hypothetical protein
MRHEMSHEGEDEPLRHLFEDGRFADSSLAAGKHMRGSGMLCKRQEDSEPRAATKLSHLLPIHSSGR